MLSLLRFQQFRAMWPGFSQFWQITWLSDTVLKDACDSVMRLNLASSHVSGSVFHRFSEVGQRFHSVSLAVGADEGHPVYVSPP